MSWTAIVQPTERDQLGAALDDTLGSVRSAAPDDVAEETAAQCDAARAAFLAVAESGAVGTGRVHGTMSGHANPGYGTRPGWAESTIALTVIRAASKEVSDGAS
jgi:hypothetical protein